MRLDSCPLQYRRLYFRRDVDNIFVHFKSSDHLKRFQSYLNYCHANISFTIETEQNNKISFLDLILNKVILQQVSIENQLLVVHTPILIAFYLAPTKLTSLHIIK